MKQLSILCLCSVAAIARTPLFHARKRLRGNARHELRAVRFGEDRAAFPFSGSLNAGECWIRWLLPEPHRKQASELTGNMLGASIQGTGFFFRLTVKRTADFGVVGNPLA